MKKLCAVSLLLLSSTTWASFVSCYDQVEQTYFETTPQARYSKISNKIDFIAPYTKAKFGRNVSFGPYEVEVNAYHATGSYHSGWFHNVIISNARTCEVIEIRTVEAE